MDAADAHPFVTRVREYAEDVLRPAALRTDREGVGEQRVAELGRLGLLNALAPQEYGGQGLGPAEDRRVQELVAGACLNTWLVWAQHAPAVARLARAPRRTELVERVLRGDALLGAALSDVRRYPQQYVAARRAGSGWTFSGTVSWVSGWGLHDALIVAAVEPETETVVTALVPVDDRTRMVPLELSVVTGSRTHRVALEDAAVAEEGVLSVQSWAEWRRSDADLASDARAHHFGLAAQVLRELAESGGGEQVADCWRPRLEQWRAEAYRLADEADPERLTERLALKAVVLEALAALTRALVVCRAGHGLALDDTAQLHARSALFLQVQGQSPAVRAAHLEQLAR